MAVLDGILYLLIDLNEIWRVKSARIAVKNIGGFRENWARKSLTFPVDVNEMTFTCARKNVHFKIKKLLVKCESHRTLVDLSLNVL